MDDAAAAPRTPKTSHRRPLAWIALGALLVVAGSALAYAGIPRDEGGGASGFRFEQTYVAVEEERSNLSKVTLNAWYTNQGEARLKDVRIVAIAVDLGSNVAVGRAEQKLGDLRSRTSFESSFDIFLNATRAHRIDLLVLVEGLIVATGHGQLGFQPGWLDDRSYLRTSEAEGLQLVGQFDYDYRQ